MLAHCQRQAPCSSFSQEQPRSLWPSPSHRQWQSACLFLHGEPSLGALRGQPGLDLGLDQAKVEASAAPSRAVKQRVAIRFLRMAAIVVPIRIRIRVDLSQNSARRLPGISLNRIMAMLLLI
jgi:hypothetical protein